MAALDKVKEFAQSVYLTQNNRYFDDIDSDDGTQFVNQVVDWTNLLLDELELEADWIYTRENDSDVGSVTIATPTLDLPEEVRKLVTDEHRPLTIQQDGIVISTWDVVSPNLITDPSRATNRDRVTVVNRKILFSRPLKDTEEAGTVIADVINFIPRLTTKNAATIDSVQPKQLLVLGVAKNATLPDIVQGGISPSFVQKYTELLEKAKAENDMSSVAEDLVRDDFGYIGGIY